MARSWQEGDGKLGTACSCGQCMPACGQQRCIGVRLPCCCCLQVKERASKAQPVVKQAKILVDEARPGADGAPRSKGIGFIEFTEHEHALCALRQLNNNPDAFHKV